MIRIALLATMLLVAPFVSANHEETEGSDVTWRLGSEGTGLRTMFRLPHPGVYGSGNTSITAGSSVLWLADEVAAANVQFQNAPEDFFLVELQVRRGTAIQLTVGSWDPTTGSFTACAPPWNHQFGSALGPAALWQVEAQRTVSVSFAFAPSSCIVPKDDVFAVKITAVGGDLKLGTLPLQKPYTDPLLTNPIPASRVIYSAASPSYPVPELPVGLLALVGLVLVARMGPRLVGPRRGA